MAPVAQGDVPDDDTALARATLRRVSARLLPFLFVLYVVNYLDRTNVAIAALQMNHDLGFSATVYSFGVGVFFLGYAPFEAPSNLLLARFGARRWLARIMISWGAIATAMMFVRTPVQFYVLRFLLGLAEAGFYPGVVYYLSEWFPKARRGRSMARFMVATPASGVIGGPIGGWILGLNGHFGLRGWQWLFLLEGIPAVVLGIVTLFYLTDSIADAHWLSDPQRTWLSERLRLEREGHFAASSSDHPLQSLENPLVWLLGLVYLLMLTAGYAQTFWTPLVVRDATQASNAVVGWLVGGISAVSALAMLVAGASSDRQEERFFHAATAAVVLAIGFVAAAVVPAPWGPLVGFTLAGIGRMAFLPPFWCIPSMMLRKTAAPLGIGIVASVGNLGGFFGPYAVGLLKDTTGSAAGAYIGVGALSLGAGLLVLWMGRQSVFVAHQRGTSLSTAGS